MKLLKDSAHFTPEGRHLLVSIGAIQPDPLRVEAERWLLDHKGARTPAVTAVRAALGPPVPEHWFGIVKAMRGVK